VKGLNVWWNSDLILLMTPLLFSEEKCGSSQQQPLTEKMDEKINVWKFQKLGKINFKAFSILNTCKIHDEQYFQYTKLSINMPAYIGTYGRMKPQLCTNKFTEIKFCFAIIHGTKICCGEKDRLQSKQRLNVSKRCSRDRTRMPSKASVMATRWFCEKNAQNEAQHIFCRN
jgi:hypothetical protein